MTSQVDQSEAVDGSDGNEGRSGPVPPEGSRPRPVKPVKRLDRVIIRFAGDSGDGMQLTGDRFTSETASFGNDLSTLP
ncbi:2-oxoglutarate ferredoxin oxidoreductase subunit alpha, partial [Kitasatospora sp. NPDC057223]